MGGTTSVLLLYAFSCLKNISCSKEEEHQEYPKNKHLDSTWKSRSLKMHDAVRVFKLPRRHPAASSSGLFCVQDDMSSAAPQC